jgi:ligand-binding sensor domain-containing protein
MKSLMILVIGMALVLCVAFVHAQTFTNFTTSDGLPDNNVHGVAIDHNNNKWFGTQSGVSKYTDSTWTAYTTADGLIDNDVKCIAVDSSGNIWAGTDFGVSKFNGTQWTSYTVADGLVNNSVTCIMADADGSVWFGTTNGLSHLTGTTWINHDSLPGNFNTVSCITADASGNKWIGTWLGGALKFDGTSFVQITSDSLLSSSVICIGIDKNNNKWLGTYYGISVFDSGDHWKKNYRQTDGLYNNYVQDIHADSKNNIWIGIYADYIQDGGITKFDGTTWTSYSITNGLVNQLVHNFSIDKKDNLWIATGAGVSKFTDKVSGVVNVNSAAVKIFPNPASGSITVDKVIHPVVLTISDLTGRKMITRNLVESSNNIDLSSLKPGMYIMELAEGSGTFSSKLIIR